MSIRGTALRWLAAHHGVRDADIFTSRYYPGAQSWSGRDAWWIQVPVHRLAALGTRPVHFVCQAAPEGAAFHYLRVPADFLRAHLPALDAPGDGSMVSLFLSAEPAHRFRDERGAGRVDFAPFVCEAPPRR